MLCYATTTIMTNPHKKPGSPRKEIPSKLVVIQLVTIQ
jgi:hypothetical protein